MMITGNGINTVTVNGKVKHITELDYITLCLEWTKLREENNRLYEIGVSLDIGNYCTLRLFFDLVDLN
ncbi:hypothetical protein E2113_20485 [Escherichia coli]|nr:hypothetical protein E2113_20485 [Escherichia coli]